MLVVKDILYLRMIVNLILVLGTIVVGRSGKPIIYHSTIVCSSIITVVVTTSLLYYDSTTSKSKYTCYIL